ncbi:unnamed protein product [Caenorhabditis angaria]|uniref:Uncharacterized protein n=1 Tax=Caenorhabditis angaria TaxID=860376 RepID=A0A9P1J228_9PELO|nr:unnamed protein product [Caenorhabditis angaria]
MSVRLILLLITLELLCQVSGKSVAKPEHQKRHKRHIKLPFVAEDLSNNPEVRRVLLSCPKTNENEPKRYLEFEELCDDIRDCPNGEDEEEHFCMFKKLEDAEIQRLKSNIRAVIRARSRKQRPINQFVTSHQTHKLEQDVEDEQEAKTEEKINKFVMNKLWDENEHHDYDDSYESEEEEEKESEEQAKESAKNANKSRISEAFRVTS